VIVGIERAPAEAARLGQFLSLLTRFLPAVTELWERRRPRGSDHPKEEGELVPSPSLVIPQKNAGLAQADASEVRVQVPRGTLQEPRWLRQDA
jgi:hypothetical protein